MKNNGISLLIRIAKTELWTYKFYLFCAIICMVGAALTTSATAYLIDPAIKEIFINKNKNLLFTLPAVIVGVSVMRGLTTYGQAWFMSIIGMNIINNIQKKMYEKLLYLDLSYLNQNHSAKIISNFVNDAASMRDAVSNVIVGLVKESLTLIGCAAVMFYQDFILASITLFVFLPVVVVIKRLMKQSSKSARHIFNETGNLSTHIAETVRGMRIVRVYVREDYEQKRADKTFAMRMKYILREARARAASSPITEAMTGVGMAAAILYAGSQGLNGKMDINNFMAFFTAMMMAYQPGRSLSGLTTKIQSGIIAAQRVYEILDLPLAIMPPVADKLQTLHHCTGKITFDNVSFSYDNKNPILDNINATIPAGKNIALVGASGGGKSTFINLIPRFYDVTAGQILIDDVPIKNMNPHDLRRFIGMVSQDAFLFNGTIRENILYGNIDATDSQMIQAAQSAAAYDFIMELPDGFDTCVGESGILLSGGQKQRIAIARAFLKDAPILLLDEATSALDNQSEASIQKALKDLSIGRTTITIAHRLSTITASDEIIVMHQGKILATGTHEFLLLNNPHYADLYRLSDTGQAVL